MKHIIAISAFVVMSSAASFAFAQDAAPAVAPVKDPAPTASPAQLKREHDRAKAAGDTANDPFNPSSSNDLNKQQLAKAQSLGNGPIYPDGTQAATTAPATDMPVMAPPPGDPAPATTPATPVTPST
jgi:hypothetical protein